MEQFDLGPNGAMLYCLEYLEKNVDWLVEKLDGLTQKYLIFDFPGQVEIADFVLTIYYKQSLSSVGVVGVVD